MPILAMNVSGWATALSISLFLHVFIAWGVMAYQQNNAINIGAMDVGDNGIDVGLGRVGTYTEMAKSMLQKVEQTMDVQAKPSVVEKTVVTKAITVKNPVVKVKQIKPQKKLKTQGDYALLEKNELIENESEKHPDKLVVKTAKLEQEVAKSAPSISTSRATGAAQDKSTGGKKGNAKSYFSQLMAWLNQHKTYPVQAKKEKQQGTVTLKFSINPQGLVLDKSIVKSSGSKLLDQSALQMLVDAQPLPQPPAELKRDRLVLQIPIEFSLITNKLLR